MPCLLEHQQCIRRLAGTPYTAHLPLARTIRCFHGTFRDEESECLQLGIERVAWKQRESRHARDWEYVTSCWFLHCVHPSISSGPSFRQPEINPHGSCAAAKTCGFNDCLSNRRSPRVIVYAAVLNSSAQSGDRGHHGREHSLQRCRSEMYTATHSRFYGFHMWVM